MRYLPVHERGSSIDCVKALRRDVSRRVRGSSSMVNACLNTDKDVKLRRIECLVLRRFLSARSARWRLLGPCPCGPHPTCPQLPARAHSASQSSDSAPPFFSLDRRFLHVPIVMQPIHLSLHKKTFRVTAFIQPGERYRIFPTPQVGCPILDKCFLLLLVFLFHH